MKVEDGGRAFPFHELSQEDAAAVGGVRGQYPGLSLRDWFAGQALAGFSATVSANGLKLMQPEPTYPIERSYAVAAYRLADALLAERKRGGE